MARSTKLTPELQAQIVKDVSNGVTFRDAALSAGISERTFYYWIEEGRNAKTGDLFQFLQSIRSAEAEARRKYTLVIAKASMDGDWRAALEYLKRHDRPTWGDNLDVTTNGKDLQPVVFDYGKLINPTPRPDGDN